MLSIQSVSQPRSLFQRTFNLLKEAIIVNQDVLASSLLGVDDDARAFNDAFLLHGRGRVHRDLESACTILICIQEVLESVLLLALEVLVDLVDRLKDVPLVASATAVLELKHVGWCCLHD